ncbi:DUF4326 domain-containing protein [Streptomyces sp. SM1]|uniref:DUF4326 domain-containing protein n=1 Tax=Streptomyces sp. SM1 TaxID=402229 RepID=UPI000CD50FEA|nr:DUF4326 domain-containing protein [Streptomyces sp. SM1]
MPTSVINLKNGPNGHSLIRDYGPRLERAPKEVVYVGRTMKGVRAGGWNLTASPLENPFTAKLIGSNEAAVAAYCRHLLQDPSLFARVQLLRGSTLACWCAPEACHADVLARLADAERADYQSLLESWAAGSGRAERDAEAAQAWQRRVSGK